MATMDRYLEDDGPGDPCPECEGEGSVIYGAVAIPCPVCDGTGTRDPLRAAEDEWDARCDLAYERAGDR